jgi:hypothetical protein
VYATLLPAAVRGDDRPCARVPAAVHTGFAKRSDRVLPAALPWCERRDDRQHGQLPATLPRRQRRHEHHAPLPTAMPASVHGG